MINNSTIGKKLNLLLFQRGMRAMDLAREIDVPQPTLHRIIAGKSQKPHKETLVKIATFFNVSINELLEQKENSITSSHEHLKSSCTHAVPMIMLQENKTLDEMIRESQDTLIVANDISEQAFAITLTDESLLPIFDIGSTLIFDPIKLPSARSYVFVLLAKPKKYIIRQLLTDGEHQFLKPLNPDIANLGVKILEAQDKILGILVEARQSYF